MTLLSSTSLTAPTHNAGTNVPQATLLKHLIKPAKNATRPASHAKHQLTTVPPASQEIFLMVNATKSALMATSSTIQLALSAILNVSFVIRSPTAWNVHTQDRVNPIF